MGAVGPLLSRDAAPGTGVELSELDMVQYAISHKAFHVAMLLLLCGCDANNQHKCCLTLFHPTEIMMAPKPPLTRKFSAEVSTPHIIFWCTSHLAKGQNLRTFPFPWESHVVAVSHSKCPQTDTDGGSELEVTGRLVWLQELCSLYSRSFASNDADSSNAYSNAAFVIRHWKAINERLQTVTK